jgi:hypothetical protein
MGIIESPKQIENKIIQAILKKMETAKNPLFANIENIKIEISQVLQKSIIDSDTFQSISNDILKRDFGLTEDVILIFTSNIADLFSIEVDFKQVNKNNSKKIYKISIEVKERDEDDPVINGLINKTSYISKRSGESIRWLEWLLFYGEKVINKSWKVYPKEGKGRSLMAVMITGRSDFKFKVNKKYAGRYGNNFVSKALEASKEDIEKIIRKYMNEST